MAGTVAGPLVPVVSAAVDVVGQCFLILLLSLEGAQPDGAGERATGSGGLAGLLALSVDLIDVEVGHVPVLCG